MIVIAVLGMWESNRCFGDVGERSRFGCGDAIAFGCGDAIAFGDVGVR
jgi:hypothetical protein